MWYDSLVCDCYDASDYIYYEKRKLSPNPSLGLSGGLEKRRSRYSSAGRAAGSLVAREALDGIMVYVSHWISSKRLFFCHFPFTA